MNIESVIGLAVTLHVGVLFILLSILMPLLRTQNKFIGIRTPWTLTSQLSWSKTHRLGGVLFALAGLLILALGLVTKLPAALVALAIVLPVTLLTSAVVII